MRGKTGLQIDPRLATFLGDVRPRKFRCQETPTQLGGTNQVRELPEALLDRKIALAILGREQNARLVHKLSVYFLSPSPWPSPRKTGTM